MTDPRRWLDEGGDATSLERDLLRDGANVDPPEGAHRAVWGSLLGQLGPGGGGGDGSPGGGGPGGGAGPAGACAAAGAVAGGGILKSALVGAACAVAVITGYSAIAPDARAPLAPPPAAIAPASPPPPIVGAAGAQRPVEIDARAATPEPGAPPGAAPVPADTDVAPREPSRAASGGAARAERAAPVTGEPSGGDPPSVVEEPAAGSGSPGVGAAQAAAAERANLLREESVVIGQARDALRNGDSGNAMRLLELARTRFPAAMLAQEREALTIEALARSGNRAAAAARAAAFLQAYPRSPHAQRVQSFAQ